MDIQLPEISMTLIQDIAIRGVTALLIFVIGRWLAKLTMKLVKRAMANAGVEDTLETFLGNLLYYVLLAAVVIATINNSAFKRPRCWRYSAPRASLSAWRCRVRCRISRPA